MNLGLVCKQFNSIVKETFFQTLVHHTWLNSIYDWKKTSDKFRKEYFVIYQIRNCMQCGKRYQEMNGSVGRRKFGVNNKFYSEVLTPGFCNQECF